MSYIEMKHSYKRYQTGETEIVANNDISFSIERGELVVILGASGAGKSKVKLCLQKQKQVISVLLI